MILLLSLVFVMMTNLRLSSDDDVSFTLVRKSLVFGWHRFVVRNLTST